MGGCRCSYKNCNSATKTMENPHFFHYPVKHRERCAIWIQNAEKPEFFNLPDDQLRNKVICGLHFEEKYFTNVYRKRLVHDAVPTLDEGCVHDVYSKDVEVLPTSVDGTTFTLQPLQPGSSRAIEAKLGYNNGKVIVHKFDDNESEVYTIDPLYIHETFYNPNNNKTIFLNSTEQQNDDKVVLVKQEQDVEMLFSQNDIQMDSNGQPLEPNPLYVDEESFASEESSISKNTDTAHSQTSSKLRKVNSKKVLKRINMHSHEIARIKNTLAMNSVKHSKTDIIRMLRGKIPDTLLGAVSLNLFKRSSDLNKEEKLFVETLYSSPSAYKTFQEFGWFIPKPSNFGIPNGNLTADL